MDEKAEIRRGTGVLFRGVAIGGAVIFVGLLTWLIFLGPLDNTVQWLKGEGPSPTSRSPIVGMTEGMPNQSGRAGPAQTSSQSTIARTDPARLEDASGGKARDIKQSNEPLQLSPEQRNAIQQAIQKNSPPQQANGQFELMIGAAVPHQARLADLPPEVPKALGGYWGDQYVLVNGTLVIVDQHSRRVAAIVQGISQ